MSEQSSVKRKATASLQAAESSHPTGESSRQKALAALEIYHCVECSNDFHGYAAYVNAHCSTSNTCRGGIYSSSCEEILEEEYVDAAVPDSPCEVGHTESRALGNTKTEAPQKPHNAAYNKSLEPRRLARPWRSHWQFTCTICSRACDPVVDSKAHFKDATIYACRYCKRIYGRPTDQIRPISEKPHSCEVCGKYFQVPNLLARHKRTHSALRPHVCTACNKSFRTPLEYAHHVRTHNAERKFKCEVCSKAFHTSGQLYAHNKTHTKPFSCALCSRRFASLHSTKAHMQTHEKQAPVGGLEQGKRKLTYWCKICGAEYLRLYALELHMQAEHKRNLWEVEQPKKDKTTAAKLATSPESDHKDVDQLALATSAAAKQKESDQMDDYAVEQTAKGPAAKQKECDQIDDYAVDQLAVTISPAAKQMEWDQMDDYAFVEQLAVTISPAAKQTEWDQMDDYAVEQLAVTISPAAKQTEWDQMDDYAVDQLAVTISPAAKQTEWDQMDDYAVDQLAVTISPAAKQMEWDQMDDYAFVEQLALATSLGIMPEIDHNVAYDVKQLALPTSPATKQTVSEENEAAPMMIAAPEATALIGAAEDAELYSSFDALGMGILCFDDIIDGWPTTKQIASDDNKEAPMVPVAAPTECDDKLYANAVVNRVDAEAADSLSYDDILDALFFDIDNGRRSEETTTDFNFDDFDCSFF